MIIAAAIGVKDEIELIERCIIHLQNIGIDLILACDVSSTDGTREVLERYESDNFRIIDIPDDTPAKIVFERVTRAIKALEADWVVLLDADEFPLPRDGDLRNCSFLHDKDVASVCRYNVPVGLEGPLIPQVITADHYHQTWLIAKHLKNFRELSAKDESIALISAPPPPKAIVRLNRFNGCTDGAHGIIPTPGPPLRITVPNDLITAHVPITTLCRLQRKLHNIRKVFSVNFDYYSGDKKKAWHWKRWIALEESGKLEKQFLKNVWDEQTLSSLRAHRTLRCALDLLSASDVPARET